MLRAGSTFLVKLFQGNFDIRKFLCEALRYLSSKEQDQLSIPTVAFAMCDAIEKNMDYLEWNEKKVTLSEVTQLLINKQDGLGISNNFHLQKCCRPYRSLSPDGILAEVVCTGILTEVASEGGRNMAIGITFHLLYDDYESAQFIIQIIIQNTKSPLQRRRLSGGDHMTGELYVDINGALFFCTQGNLSTGNPTIWKRVQLVDP
jgi:hypothetical protein